MRAILIDNADHTAGVAEGEQLLAHDDNLLRRAVGVRQFFGKQRRNPEPPKQFTHAGACTTFGEKFVVFCAEHGADLRILFCFWPSLAQAKPGVNACIIESVAHFLSDEDCIFRSVERSCIIPIEQLYVDFVESNAFRVGAKSSVPISSTLAGHLCYRTNI